MAPSGLEQDWQKLHINTESLDNSRNPSRAGSYDGQIIYGDTSTGLESGGLNIKSNPNIPPLDLNGSWHAGDDRSTHLSPDAGDFNEHGRRERNRSISFDPEATLDDGAKHSLEQPLPRTGSLRSVTAADRPNSSRRIAPSAPVPFDPATTKINPFTGEPISRRRPRRQDTGSTGMSIVDSFGNSAAAGNGDPHFPSLTSGSTASPPHDEAQTPMSTQDSYLDSPTAVSSPAFSPHMESEPWPAFRSGSIRSTRTLPPSRPMSLRKESRRSSKRSASSSFSPASAFLSKWGRDSINSAAPDPDDEGQSFGLENDYIIGRQIGYGGFSVVKEAFSITADGEKKKHAVKIVRKNIREKQEMENEKCQQELEHEVGIWKYLDHPHILSLIAVFDTDFATFCVMDLNEGGSMYDLVRDSRKSGTKLRTSGLVKSYSFQLASALRYLHEDVRVVHRDVKMENCLIDRDRAALQDKPGKLRLCDFGLADFISSDTPDMAMLDGGDGNGNKSSGSAANVVGSLEYAAPEVLRTEKTVLNPTVDIWAYGVCVFTLITGDRPFKHSLAARVVELIMAAKWDEDIVRGALGDDPHAEDIMGLLKGCITPDVGARWDIAQVLASPWFADCADPYAVL